MRLDYVARPAGSKPAAVYWRRRAVVLIAIVLLVWFAAKACGGSGSGNSTRAASSSSIHASAHSLPSAQTTAPAGGDAPSAAAVGNPGATSSPSASDSTASTGSGAVTAMCDPSSLSLRAAVDRLSLRRPFTAGITLQIATRAPSPCGLDASALRAQVLDGSQVLWSSDGCPSAGAAGTGPAPGSGPGTTPSTATPGGSAAAPASGGPAAASGGSATASAGGSGLQNVIAVPSQATADQHYTWHGNTCSGQLAPGRYDVVGRLGVAEAFAGTVTVS